MKQDELKQLFEILKKRYKEQDETEIISDGFMFILHPRFRFYDNSDEELFQFGEILWDEIADIIWMESGVLIETQLDETQPGIDGAKTGKCYVSNDFWPYEAIIGMTNQY